MFGEKNVLIEKVFLYSYKIKGTRLHDLSLFDSFFYNSKIPFENEINK